MPAYLMVQIKISDEAAWPAYRAAVGPCAAKFGGRYVVRGAAVEVLEGTHDGRSLVVFEFPMIEAVRSFWQSPDYAQVKALREGIATLDVWAVPGV